VYLERVDVQNDLDFTSLPSRIDESILSRDTNIAVHRNPAMIKHQYLLPDELPRPGTVVAIDAEFVLMQQVSLTQISDRTFLMGS
jgi:PAB-dependent poly(A)-specific ribonuclease subunit 2